MPLLRQNKVPKEETSVKILLLGTAQAGKTTLFKHMRWMDTQPSEDEKKHYREPMVGNVLQSLRGIVDAAENHFHYHIDMKHQGAIARIQDVYNTELTKQDVVNITSLWEEPAVQRVFARRHEIPHVLDSCDYFINSLDKICSPDYTPTFQEILKVWIRSIGIFDLYVPLTPSAVQIALSRHPLLSVSLKLHPLPAVKVVDLGGRRGERRKWIHAFENLSEIVFLVSLSEFSSPLNEDVSYNRMRESLTLFAEVCNAKLLSGIPIILVFTKDDIFREKIQHASLRKCFPDYSGAHEYYEARDYIIEQFVAACPQKGRITHVLVGNLMDISFAKDIVNFTTGNALYSFITSKKS